MISAYRIRRVKRFHREETTETAAAVTPDAQKPRFVNGYGRMRRAQRYGWIKIDYSRPRIRRAPAQWQLEQMMPQGSVPSYSDRDYQAQKTRYGAICGAVEIKRERRTFLPRFLKRGDAA